MLFTDVLSSHEIFIKILQNVFIMYIVILAKLTPASTEQL